jgi:O-antigen/teichoic acid export membrane protein
MDEAKPKKDIIGRLLRSTISNYVGRFVGLATWFLLTPFILGQLNADLYGLWALVGSVVAYGSLLDFGIAGAVTKYVAEYEAKGELEAARRLVATALALYAVLGLVVVAAGFALAPLFPRLFNVSAEHRETAVWLVRLSGSGMGLAIISASTTAVLRGLQRFDLMNLLGVVTTLLVAGVTVLILLSGGGILGMVGGTVAVNFLMQIPAVWFIYRIAPELRFGWARPSRAMLWTVSSFSSSIFLVHVGGQLETKTDEIVVGAFMPISAVTPYNLARKLSNLPQMMTEQFLSLLLPLASALHAENDQARLRTLYITSTRLALGAFLTFGISLAILAGPILTIWVGAEYAEYGYLIVVLTLASLIDIPTWPAGSVLQGIARHRFTAVMALCTGITNLGLSLILVQRLGLLGVALGTLIPTIIFGVGFTIPYAMRVIGVTFSQMYRQALWPTLIPLVPAALIAYIMREIFEPTTILPTLFIAAVGSLLYLAGYLKAASSQFERDLVQDMLVKAAARARQFRSRSKEEVY